MKTKYYKHIHTGEIVYEDEAELYVFEKLKITVKAENGVLTDEQKEFIKSTTEWYFSGNWIQQWEDMD
nr:MAG TPA: VRR-NUC domain protein [Caudoviricetes sp.]